MLDIVQSPFIIVTIGDNTFGTFSDVDFPNFMTSLEAVKINGTVNQYVIKMSYQISYGDDPNLLEKVFSTVSSNRFISIQYGDYSTNIIYKEEKAVITKITSNFNIKSSQIEYTISCTGNGLQLNSTKFNFPATKSKGSDVLKSLLNTPKYGIKGVFKGMSDAAKVLSNNLIASDDKVIQLQAKNNCSILDYLKYVTNSMQSESNSTDSYQLVFYDEEHDKDSGTFFKVVKQSLESAINSATQKSNSNIGSVTNSINNDTLTVNVGYPDDNNVISLTVQNDETWSFLYDYDEKVSQSQKRYSIDNSGKIVTTDSSSLAINGNQMKATAAQANWLNNVTNYPITVQLTMLGLSKATMLMDKINLHVIFYGQEHIISGVYVVKKQVDSVSTQGFRTSLTLLRVGGFN